MKVSIFVGVLLLFMASTARGLPLPNPEGAEFNTENDNLPRQQSEIIRIMDQVLSKLLDTDEATYRQNGQD